jgi:amino acid transporter
MAEDVFVRKATGLVREVGPFTVLALGAGFTIADGIHFWAFQVPFYNPGTNYLISMSAGFIFELLATICLLFLTVAMPRTASDYVAVSRTLHPILGYLDTWLAWQANVILVGMISYITATCLGTTLYLTGAITHSTDLLTVGQLMSTNLMWGLGIGAIFVFISALFCLFGMRAYKYTLGIPFAIALIGTVVELGAPLWALTTHQSVQSLWNSSFGEGAYQEVVNVAVVNGWEGHTGGVPGWPGKWSWNATLAAIPAACYLWWGFGYANYVAGEVSEPSKSFLIGFLGSAIITAIFYYISIGVVYAYYGDFLSQYDYVILGGYADQLTIQPSLTPSLMLYSAATVGGAYPWLAAIIGLTGTIWVYIDVPIAILVVSRMTFAMSFDRFFPETFAKVSDRWHSPTNAIILVTALSFVTLYISVYYPWVSMLNAFAGMIWRYVLASWACMLLPFAKPEIYKRGYTWTVGGLPVVFIVGALSTIITTWFFFWVVWSIPQTDISLWWNTFWWSFALILFAAYYIYNQKRGIDVESIWKTIPPA